MSRNIRPSDSLELFLDTICNTFGGILFILLFVVLLLKGTERRFFDNEADKNRQGTTKQLSVQLEKINADIETAEEQRSAVSEKLDMISLPMKESATQILKEQTAKFDQLLEEETNLKRELEGIQTLLSEKNNLLIEEESNLQQQIADLKKCIEEIGIKARNARKIERREQSMPQLRDTETNYIGLVLCFGRLYKLHNISAYNRTSRELNTDDFVVVKTSLGECHVSPKPWCGIDLRDMDSAEREIREFVSAFSTVEYRVALVVCDDSFRYFGPVSAILKQLGFMIEPVMFSELIGWGISDRGGSEAKAQ